MRKRVLETLVRRCALPSPATIVVGVSGGADSMALLHILFLLRVHCAATLHVAHVHYGVRREDAADDAALVAHTAAHYQLPYHVCDLSQASSPTTSEAVLRAQRYAFFEDVRKKVDADVIAVGHHQDDLAETVLLHIIRGTGIDGLGGMSYRRDTIIRPLLDCTRAMIRTYCTQNKIIFHEDTTNADPRYLRNRIRHELLPLLATYNPAIAPLLARNAENWRNDAEFIRTETAKFFPVVTETAHGLSFRAQDYRACHPSVQYRFLHACAAHYACQLPQETVRHWHTLISGTRTASVQTQQKGLLLSRKNDTVLLTRYA